MQVLAGVADRGGLSAVIECTTTGLEEGRYAKGFRKPLANA